MSYYFILSKKKLFTLTRKINIVIFLYVFLISSTLFSDILESPNLIISYNSKDKKIAEKIILKFSEIAGSVKRDVGIYPVMSQKTHLILCHNKSDYKHYIEEFKTLPEGSIAFAVPKKGCIVIQNPRTMPVNAHFYRVLTHEYNHILLHAIAPDIHIPLWFDEGFAQYFAKQWNFKREFIFVTNALKGNILDLKLFYYHYPKHKNQLEIFYLQSYYTIKFLIDRFSKTRFYEFLEALPSSKNFEITFLKIYGISLIQFIDETRKSIKSHTILTIFYSGFGLFWIIMPLLLFIAYIRKRILRKKIEESWKQEDLTTDDSDKKYLE